VNLPLVPGQRRAEAPTTECYDDVCITCSDEAVEVTVVELLDGDLALVDTGQGIEEVSVMLVAATPGMRILVHAKEAIGLAAPSTPPPAPAPGGRRAEDR
jgi:hydrogenase expression/formation protein HypC